VHASADCVEVGQHILPAVLVHQLHRGLAGKVGQRLRSIPSIGKEGRTKSRLDFVEHFDHLPHAALAAIRGYAILTRDRILAEAKRLREFIGGGAQNRGDLLRRKYWADTSD